MLCFTSPALTEPLEVTGHVKLTLFASSSAPDTDFTGKLVDVFPDGRAISLTDGIIRARYRNSLAAPELLTPGEPYELSMDLSVTSNVFLPGHRIRLEVSSSNFPRFDRNTNTGGVIADESEDQATVAVNRVLHGPGYLSQLNLARDQPGSGSSRYCHGATGRAHGGRAASPARGDATRADVG